MSNFVPIHHRKSEHLHLRRPRNLLKSQKSMSNTRFEKQSKYIPPKEVIN